MPEVTPAMVERLRESLWSTWGRNRQTTDWPSSAQLRLALEAALMDNLTTLDTFEVTGRGTVHVVDYPPGVNPRKWLGEDVLIDGQVRRVKGVETFAVPDRGLLSGGRCGLLVEGLTDSCEPL